MPKASKRKFVVTRQADVAEAFAVSPSSVKDWVARGMPGRTGDYSLPAIAKWLRTVGPWSPKAKPDSDDPLLFDESSGSVGLERLRQAKAELAELELSQRMGEVIPVDRARAALLRWATIIRNAGERLGKRHGADAAHAINDALEDCERVINDEFPSDNSPSK